eukprot:CAMPEP_0116143802 /NCGR_PEP_ID=MMETSP0329-20121206/15645_1 /TAXON_ID=697910 /ORGANISM="Pseudo-nitzschia arenysensis, Strain B593" /LENGTH=348 /DNA_ID=CAMNT_0003639147 /DNA_START=102 /DNA_END=1148 /DNA_ORIENTATION=-
MKKIFECRHEKLAVRILFCYTLLLLQFVRGFTPLRNVATNVALSKYGSSKFNEPSSTIRIRQRRIISATSLSSASQDNIDSSNEFIVPSMGSSAIATEPISSLNPIEAWCTTHMNVWYDKSLSVKCPFFRRRMTDFLDGADMVMRFLVIRHKSLDLIGPPPGCRSTFAKGTKCKNLELTELVETIRSDWKPNQNKGYYITGRLNTTIYRDDCYFDGPDPDMPVRGVRKYLNAASQLFDKSSSTAELLSLEIGDADSVNKNKSHRHQKPRATIVARWKLKGVLHLPWHPSLPVWTGTTTYHLDDEHMVYFHEEEWDISVFRAFTQTLWPELGNLLWRPTGEGDILEPDL